MNNIILSKNKTIKSTELVEIINQFRKLESEATGKEYKELSHYDFYKKITRELNILKTLGIADGNISVSEYKDRTGRTLPCYELTKDGMLQMLNSESALVRYKTIKYIDELEEQIKEPIRSIGIIDEIKTFGAVADLLNMNDNSKLLGVHKIYEEHNLSTACLPQYTQSRGILKSATELLKDNDINISTIKFNSLLVRKGILKELTRESSKGKPKKFKSIVNTYYGENQVNPKSPKETQPMYYEDKFKELLKEIDLI